MSDSDLEQISISLRNIPQRDLDSALGAIMRSFNVVSLSLREHGRDFDE